MGQIGPEIYNNSVFEWPEHFQALFRSKFIVGKVSDPCQWPMAGGFSLAFPLTIIVYELNNIMKYI